jgi:hypothetical protein
MNPPIKVATHNGRDVFYDEERNAFFVKGADGNPAMERDSLAAVREALDRRAAAAEAGPKPPPFERVRVMERTYDFNDKPRLRFGLLTSADGDHGWVLWDKNEYGRGTARAKEDLKELLIDTPENRRLFKRSVEQMRKADAMEKKADKTFDSALRADKYLRARRRKVAR